MDLALYSGSCDRLWTTRAGRVNKAKHALNPTLVCDCLAIMSRPHSSSSTSTNRQSSLDAINSESSRQRSQIASEIDEADDPLALYDRFVKWIFDEYPREHLPSSGLIEQLEEATRRFKDDSSYKGDLRYLKLWTLYASLADKPSVVYKFILTNGIGTVYALLFEDYALTLERDGRCVHNLTCVIQHSHSLKVIRLQVKSIAQVYNEKRGQ